MADTLDLCRLEDYPQLPGMQDGTSPSSTRSISTPCIHTFQPWNPGLSKGMSKRRYGTSLLSRSTSRMFVCYSLVDRNIDGQPGLSGFMLQVQTLYLAIASLAVRLVETYSHQQRCFWYDLRNIIFQS